MSQTEEKDSSPDDAVEINLTPERLLDVLRHAATKDRTVVEFRKGDNGDLEQIVEITDHVETLEDEQQV